MNTENCILKIEEILDLIPHRYPFLLIDRILDFKKNQFLRSLKNVSINESFFQGHFPEKPIFPGVLILEAIAQSANILICKSIKIIDSKKECCYLTSIDKTRFKYPVFPGDQMIIEVNLKKIQNCLIQFQGIALVNKKTVCKSTITCIRKKEF